MNVPFSLGDILERIIPGALFLSSLYLMLQEFRFVEEFPSAFSDDFTRIALLFALSYALGVLFNVAAGLVPYIDLKYKPLNEDDEPDTFDGLRVLKIKDAVKDVFDLDCENSAWRLCYGIAHRTDYSPNIELFAKLNVFCRSMMIATLLITLIAILEAISLRCFETALLAGFCLIGTYMFALGARLYSQSFASAIYEAFYSWYVHERLVELESHQMTGNQTPNR